MNENSIKTLENQINNLLSKQIRLLSKQFNILPNIDVNLFLQFCILYHHFIAWFWIIVDKSNEYYNTITLINFINLQFYSSLLWLVKQRNNQQNISQINPLLEVMHINQIYLQRIRAFHSTEAIAGKTRTKNNENR